MTEQVVETSERGLVVCVLGMHRSGTSCLAGAIQEAGLFAGTVQQWNSDNLKGNRENLAIMMLNNVVLENNQSTWDSPPETLRWNAQHQAQRDQILKQMGHQSLAWIFKDPRTLLTLPFWQEGMNNLHQPLQFVGTFRHPAKVALSLYQRSQMPLQKGIQLWLHYNQKLLQAFQRSPFPLLCFDLPKAQYLEQLYTAIQQLNAVLSQDKQLSVLSAKRFYAEKLVNQQQAVSFVFHSDASDCSEQQLPLLFEEAEALYQALRTEAGISRLPSPTDTAAKQNLSLPLTNTVAAYQKVLETQPDSPQLYFMLGNAQRQQDDLNAAASSYRKALDLNYTQPFNVYKALCEALTHSEAYEEAIATYQQGIQQTNHLQLHVLLAQTFIKAQRFDEAESTLKHLIEQQPDRVHYKVTLANLYLNKKIDLEAAITVSRQAIALEPKHPIAQRQLGVALMR